ASTDAFGYFKFTEVPVGRYDIRISFLGYKPLTVPNIMVSSGKEVVLEINIEESVEELEEVIVKGNSIMNETNNSMTTVSARTFSVEDTRRYAGAMDDPARMASSFAGVTVGNIQDNAIIIRGNSPKNVLWRLEGVEIPNPNHFAGGNVAGGGFVTIFSSQMLANSDFFTGAFPAEYGNATAGVFDMKLRPGNNEEREYTFQAGLLGIDFSAEGPFIKGKKASYLINYRFSTFSLIAPFIPSEQIPRYQDLSFKFNFPTKKAGTFSLWSIGAKDVNTEPNELDSTKWEYDWDRVNYEWNLDMGVVGLTHKIVLGKSTFWNTSAVLSGLSNRMDQRRLDDDLVVRRVNDFKDLSSKFTVSAFVNHKFGAKHTNRTGVIYNSLFYNMYLKYAPNNIPLLVSLVDEKGNADFIQAYTQSKFNLTDRLTFNIGVHSQFFTLNNNYTTEPRAGFRWNFGKKHSLSFGYGNHSALELLNIYLYQKHTATETTLPNKDLDFTKAHHLVLGYDWYLTDQIRLRVEPYYQYLYNVPVIQDSSYSMINFTQEWTFANELVNEGTGVNIGVDLTLERFLSNNLYYLVTASLFDSKYIGGDGIEYSSRYDKAYSVNILAGKEFGFGRNKKKNILGINTRVSITGGQRTAPVDMETSLAMKEVQYDWYKAFQDQNRADIFVDLTLPLRRNKAKYSSSWAIQVKNILGSKSNFNWDYNLRTNSVVQEGYVIIVPNISYKIEF
ncbi:MAG: TonB-dependent receptor, partial [Bacteroidales bacterium]|nr:TonB-dependent receptor [Bacteroidales bacterium]